MFEQFWSFQTFWMLFVGIQVSLWLRMESGYSKARIAARKRRDSTKEVQGISVIVAAKNEADQIGNLLSALEAQVHPVFEVIVVDDHSTDSTADVVRRWNNRDSRYSLLESDGSGKKAALQTGIEAAKYDICAFTDADCFPPPSWLARHASYYDSDSKVGVVGFAPLRTKKGLLGLVQRFDVEFAQFFAASSIGNKLAFMATGRNLSYSRELFEEVEGFSRHAHTVSGDDDLLLQDIRTKTDATIYWDDSAEILVESEPQNTWSQWLRQKRRHSSDGRLFVKDVKIAQALFYGTFMGVWFAGFFDLGFAFVGWPILLAVQLFSMWDIHRLFGHRYSLWWLPFLSAWFAFYSLVVPITGFLRPPSRWS